MREARIRRALAVFHEHGFFPPGDVPLAVILADVAVLLAEREERERERDIAIEAFNAMGAKAGEHEARAVAAEAELESVVKDRNRADEAMMRAEAELETLRAALREADSQLRRGNSGFAAQTIRDVLARAALAGSTDG